MELLIVPQERGLRFGEVVEDRMSNPVVAGSSPADHFRCLILCRA